MNAAGVDGRGGRARGGEGWGGERREVSGKGGAAVSFIHTGAALRAARARRRGTRAFGGGGSPDVPLAGATRAALAAAERANMSAKLALVRTGARRPSRRTCSFVARGASRRLPAIISTTNGPFSFFSDWYPCATKRPFTGYGRIEGFVARRDVFISRFSS